MLQRTWLQKLEAPALEAKHSEEFGQKAHFGFECQDKEIRVEPSVERHVGASLGSFKCLKWVNLGHKQHAGISFYNYNTSIRYTSPQNY